jgi:hypothetical protein
MHRLRSRDVLLVLLAAWVGAWIFAARFHFLDDALIHLRYADLLREKGFLTFDGVHPSNGTSSVLYVVLLAAAGRIFPSVFLPKLLSVIGYVALLGITLKRALKSWGVARSLWFLLLLVLASPMAIRWFTDGMETSLATALALLIGYRTMPGGALSAGFRKSRAPLLLAFGWVFLRVETAFLLAFLCLAYAAWGFGTGAKGGRIWGTRRERAGEIQLAMGAALAMLTIRLITGYIISDAAIAKAEGFYGVMPYARLVARAFAASLSLGLGMLLIWVASAILGGRCAGGAKAGALAVVNLALPAELLIAMGRGQMLQGVRYFLPALAVMIAWNLAFLEANRPSGVAALTPQHPPGFFSRIGPLIIPGLAILMLCAWPLEGHIVRRIIGLRGAAFQQMRSQHLEALAGRVGVAYDIGFISYFTHATLCDMGGLVNGREFARMPPDERARRCAASSPGFAYVNAGQRDDLSAWIDFRGWSVCHVYEPSNVFDRDRHYLLVTPDIAPGDCGKAGSTSP